MDKAFKTLPPLPRQTLKEPARPPVTRPKPNPGDGKNFIYKILAPIALSEKKTSFLFSHSLGSNSYC